MADLSLDGLASGMGTGEIINQLVEIERRSIINLEREKISLEESKSAWRDVNTRLSNLEDQINNLKSTSTFDSMSSTSSDKEIITATVNDNASEGDYQINVNSVAQAHRLGATTKISNNDNLLSDELGTPVDGDISINGTNITIDTDETLSSLKTKINDSNSNVSATIIDGNLVLESTETGSANNITLSDNTNNLLDNLGLNGDLNDINNDSVLQIAQNANIEVNGITGITSSDNTFSDVVEGVTFTLDKDAQSDDTANISVTKDIEKASSSVKKFVDQYNSVMNFIDKKTNYNSETEDSGVLQGDGTLMRLQMKMRSMVTSRIDSNNDYNQLASVGISVDRDGVMSFDSSELEEALRSNQEDVINLFNAEKSEDGFNGVATNLKSYLDQLIQTNTGTIPRELDFYDTRMETIDDDIEDQERRLDSVRQRYEEQFTAMEKALSEMQQQQSWMQSQLSSLAGTSSLINSMG